MSNIHYWISRLDYRRVKDLIDDGCRLDNPMYGLTPLIEALFTQDLDMIYLILDNWERGIDVNYVSITGNTALSLAVEMESLELVRILLLHGADPDQVILIRESETPLMIACRTGNQEIVKLLLAEDQNLDQQNLFGQTALHITCQLGYHFLIPDLIESGSDIHIQDFGGKDALETGSRHRETVKTLIQLCGTKWSSLDRIFVPVNRSHWRQWVRWGLRPPHPDPDVQKVLDREDRYQDRIRSLGDRVVLRRITPRRLERPLKRQRMIQELDHLPPGVVSPDFPGGEAYRKLEENWK